MIIKLSITRPPDIISLVEKPIGQTRRGSIIEACANVLIGFWINFTANMLIFPLFGFHISPGANFVMGLLYTVISIVRSYMLRRVFNKIRRLHHA